MKVRLRITNTVDEVGHCYLLATVDLQHLPIPAVGTELVIHQTTVRVTKVAYEMLGGYHEVVLDVCAIDPVLSEKGHFTVDELRKDWEFVPEIVSGIEIA